MKIGRGLLVLTALTSAALAATPHAVTAQDDPATGVVLRSEIGVRGFCEVGSPVTVKVNLSARQAFRGAITVAKSDTGAGTVTTMADVAGGAEKQFRLVTSCADWGRVVVQARSGDDVVAEQQLQAKTNSSHELVGVMPALVDRAGDLPEQVPLDGDVGRAVLAELMPDDVALGPSALSAFDSIAATGGDVSGLTADERRSLFTWVGEGGRLLLDDDTQVGALPAAWRPGPDGYAWAGAGEVRLTDGEGAAGSWGSIVQPSIYRAGEFGTEGFDMMFGPEQGLVERSGLDEVGLNTWLIALAIYALVIGPIAYMVLRGMRRLTLAWIAIPLLAVLTGGTVLAAGSGLRGGAHTATGSYIETSAGGSTALTTALVLDGHSTLDLADGWGMSIDPWGGGFMGEVRAVTTIEPGGESQLELGLEAGQSSVVPFEGTTDVGGLTTTAVIRGGKIVGTVTNDTGFALRDVAVFAGGKAMTIGDLAEGASADWNAPLPTRVSAMDSPANNLWGGFNRFGEPSNGRGTVAEAGVWGSASRRHALHPTGYARVAGWTDQWTPPIDQSDNSSNITAISSLTPIDNGRGPLRAAAVRASVVRSPFNAMGEALGNDIVIRYLLPPGADPSAGYEITQLSDNAADGSGLKLWTGDDWTTVPVEDQRVDVPAAAVRNGVVLMRVTVQPEKIGPEVAIPLLQQKGAGE